MADELQSFLTGFFGTRASKMQADQDKADAAEERMRNIAERNKIIAQNRTTMANTAKSMGDQLLAWGATPDQIQAALGSGQTGLADLYKTVSTVHSTLNADEAKRFLGTVGADLGAAGAVGKEGLDNLYRSTFGMPMGTKTGDFKAPQESTLAKVFGYTDRKAKMMQELDAELSGVGGYSVYDLTTISALPDYIPGSAGENIMYRQPSIYTKANYSDALDDVRKDITMVRQSGAFENVETNIASLDKQILDLKAGELTNIAKAKIKELEGLKAAEVQKRDSLLDNSLRETILTKSNMYFNSDTYLEDMQSFIESTLGYTPSWMPDLIESEKQVNAIVSKSLGGNLVTEAGDQTSAALAGVDPVAAKPTVIRTIKTEAGKELNVVEVNGKTLVQTTGGTLMSEEDSAEVIAAAEEAGTATKVSYTSKAGEMPAIGDIMVDPTVVTQSDAPITWDAVTDFAGSIWKKVSENVAGSFEDKGMSIAGYTDPDVKKEVEAVLKVEGITPEMLEDAANRAPEYLDTLMGQVEAAITRYTEMKAAEPENRMVKVVEDLIKDVPDFTKTTETEPDYAAAAMRAPEHLEKLGEQAKSVAKALSDAISKAVGKAQNTAQEARAAKAALQEQGVTTEGMSERETIEAYDRQFLSDWKNMPVALKTIVLGSMVGKDKGMTEEETIRDLDRQFIMDWEGMPVQNKTIIRDVLYGKRVESFTDEQNKRLNEMRQTNPEWFIDTPPLGLPVPDASQVDTTFKSRTDRPTGMMSPLPAQRAGLEATPALGDTELDSMLTRIYGEGSADMQKFMNKVHTGKVKAADVTRIINSTKKLPKTDTRAKVLEKLYSLRDSIK